MLSGDFAYFPDEIVAVCCCFKNTVRGADLPEVCVMEEEAQESKEA